MISLPGTKALCTGDIMSSKKDLSHEKDEDEPREPKKKKPMPMNSGSTVV